MANRQDKTCLYLPLFVPRLRAISIFMILSGIFFIISCQEDEDNPVRPIESYDADLMFYPSFVPRLPKTAVRVEYNKQGKVVKRIGGVLTLTGVGGYSSGIYPEIYDTIIYTGNEIQVLQKESFALESLDDPYQRQFFTENDKVSLIIRPTVDEEVLIFVDSIFFSYTETGLIEKTVQRSWRMTTGPDIFRFEEVKNFYFESENLKSIEGTRTTRQGTVTTTLELFENYDQARNPTYRLGIFDEVFYRSLSKNNFTRYYYQRVNSSGTVIDAIVRDWVLNYDKSGIPTYQ